MKLRKQLFAAFFSVAVLPLVVVGIYMFISNLMLAFNLYEQNLRSSTDIQTDLVEENINRLMVRAGRFAASRSVKDACMGQNLSKSSVDEDLSKDILNFTDETLDNVAIFALTDKNGVLMYSSGSNSDTSKLTTILKELQLNENQEVTEIMFDESGGNLLIATPVKENMQIIGRFLVVCRTDYLLRIISSHKQIEFTDSLIYCESHHTALASKLSSMDELPELYQKLSPETQGSFICRIGKERNLVYYRRISKTPWILANVIPTKQIFSRVWDFGFINIMTLLLVFWAILLLSRRQSIRMLKPLEQLLESVEQFFISGAKNFRIPEVDPETEIGYLAEKFSGVSKAGSIAQERLRESTYLYNTLLQATYEFRLIIDLCADTLHCGLEPLAQRLIKPEGISAPERVFLFLTEQIETAAEVPDVLKEIVFGRLMEPMEIEVCCDMGRRQDGTWYRLVSVPIMGNEETVVKVVLHFEDITLKKQEELHLIQSSQKDPLCGLLNKTAFPLHCKLSGSGETDAVFFIDLDSFKQVNDRLGHMAGDEVLVSTAQAIRSQFRDSDVIGRFGGDEFVVLATSMTREQAQQKAGELVRVLSFYKTSPPVQIHVTASVGVCIVRQPMDLPQAIKIADEAMYHAKENGKSQYVIT